MQKVIGGILILSATAGAGVVYGNELKRYLRNMVYLRYVFGLIRVCEGMEQMYGQVFGNTGIKTGA